MESTEEHMTKSLRPKSRSRTLKPPEKAADLQMGPLRIIIIDSTGRYIRTSLMSICHALTQFMLGAVNTMVLAYAIKFGDTHAVLCTVGWHFFSAEAILGLSYANGWATPIKVKHRKRIHMVLQICSIMIIFCGCMLIIINKGATATFHNISGYIALIGTIITVLWGPFAISRNQKFKVVHLCFGLFAFTLSSMTLCIGINQATFKKFSGTAVAIILIVFVALYTCFIVYMCTMKCVMRIKYLI